MQQSQKNTTQEVLIQDVPTRWNSTLQMIERLLRNKEPVIATLAAPSHKHSLNLLTEAEWEKLRTLKMLLEPCRYATVVLGGEKYVSCSVVLPIVTYLRRFMVVSDDDPAFAVRFKTAFTNDLDARLGNCNVSWLKLSTALDPRFKRLKCVPKAERGAVWTELQSLIAAVDSHTGTSRHLSQHRNVVCTSSPQIQKTIHRSNNHKQLWLCSVTNLKARLTSRHVLLSGGSHMPVPTQPLSHWLANISQLLPQLFHVNDCFQCQAISSARNGPHCHQEM